MKKLISGILSMAAGALTMVVFLLPFFIKTKTELGSTYYYQTSGWGLLKNSNSNLNGYLLFRVCSIILLVLAVVAMVLGLLTLLYNLKVLKITFNIGILTNCNLWVCLILSIFAVIGIGYMAEDATITLLSKIYLSASIGFGAWLLIILLGAASAVGLAFEIVNSKNHKTFNRYKISTINKKNLGRKNKKPARKAKSHSKKLTKTKLKSKNN